jgi:predicted HAD superfamily phosphohydrolase YqeG
MTLASFLKGQKNKVIEIYNLDRINNFGMIEEKYSKRVFPLLKELVNHGIIGTITDKYETLILSNDSPDEETIKSIFTNIVFKEH